MQIKVLEKKVALLIEVPKDNSLSAQTKISAIRWTINTFTLGAEETADNDATSAAMDNNGWSNSYSGNTKFRVK